MNIEAECGIFLYGGILRSPLEIWKNVFTAIFSLSGLEMARFGGMKVGNLSSMHFFGI